MAVVALLLLALVWGLQRQLIYFPSTAPAWSADSTVPGARDVVLRTSDGMGLGA